MILDFGKENQKPAEKVQICKSFLHFQSSATTIGQIGTNIFGDKGFL